MRIPEIHRGFHNTQVRPGAFQLDSSYQFLGGNLNFQKIPTIHRQPRLKQRGKCPKIPLFKKNFRRNLQPEFEDAAKTPEEETDT